jgi:solute carrier family 25 S-adenosylmethionine transporter 26
LRDVPFSLVEIPLWEALKKWLGKGEEVSARGSAFCGAVAGCTAAAITNPLDVAKTRIILAQKDSTLSRGSILTALQLVYKEKGWRGMTAGVAPRMAWMSLGGFLFLGTYDFMKKWMYNPTAVEVDL